MCAWGTTLPVLCKVPADLSHTGQEQVKECQIDACIAKLVYALQVGGVETRASCCGHGKEPGNIVLADGRTLRIEGAVGSTG